MANVFDEIREKLDADQIEDKDDLISDLIDTLDAIRRRLTGEEAFIENEEFQFDVNKYLKSYEGPVATCEWETYRATLETPAEYCENNAIAGSDYCELHD